MSTTEQTVPFITMDKVNAGITPGPWKVENTSDTFAIIAPRKGCKRNGKMNSWKIASVGDYCLWDDAAFKREDRANARLIAAAPDMLAALRLFVDRIEAFGEWDDGCLYYGGRSVPELERPLREARAAIAKATQP